MKKYKFYFKSGKTETRQTLGEKYYTINKIMPVKNIKNDFIITDLDMNKKIYRQHTFELRELRFDSVKSYVYTEVGMTPQRFMEIISTKQIVKNSN